MLVSLAEIKQYLRVDGTDEDEVITSLMATAGKLAMDVARAESEKDFEALGKPAKMAVLYGTAYLFEHREEADYHELILMLRSLLFGVREAKF